MLPVVEVGMENGHVSVGGGGGGGVFQSDSLMTDAWVPSSNHHDQPRVADYIVTSSIYTAANGVVAPGTDTKPSNRPTGPRKPKSEFAVSNLYWMLVCWW